MYQLWRIISTFDVEPVVLWLLGPSTIIYGALVLVSPASSPIVQQLPMPWFSYTMIAFGVVMFVGLGLSSRKIVLAGIIGGFAHCVFLSILVLLILRGTALGSLALLGPYVAAAAWAGIRLYVNPMRLTASAGGG